MDTINPLMFSVREAARKMGIGKTSLYGLWKSGLGPPRIKIGKRTLIPVNGLDAWIKEMGGNHDA